MLAPKAEELKEKFDKLHSKILNSHPYFGK